MTNPLVSVVMSVYNGEKYIAAAISSVLQQTWTDLELIVVNDGSTDASAAILGTIDDPRLKVLHQENKGQDAALNKGYVHSTGSYIKFMDCDDLISPQTLEVQVKALLQSPEKIAYGEWYRFFGAEPTPADMEIKNFYWKDSGPLDFLLQNGDGPMLQCGIMLVPRPIIEKAGLWDERLILYNDTEFFARIILNAQGILFTPGAVLFYRSGVGSSLSNQNQRKYFESTYLAVELISQEYLKREDSPRVRQIICNLYFRRRYEMYPSFPDLARKYRQRVKEFGPTNLFVGGSAFHNFSYNYLGWRITKLMHNFRGTLLRSRRRRKMSQ
jgi:glycosyltransferase involved in cell wall biosynthesis